MVLVTAQDIYEVMSGSASSATLSKLVEYVNKWQEISAAKFNSRNIAYEPLDASEVDKIITELMPAFMEMYQYRDLTILTDLVIPYAIGSIMISKKLLDEKYHGVWGEKGIVSRPLEAKLYGKTSWDVTIDTADTWVDFIGTSTTPFQYPSKTDGFGAAAVVGIEAQSEFVPAYINARTWKNDREKFLIYTGHVRQGDFVIIKFNLGIPDSIFTEKDELYIRVKDPALTGTSKLHPIGVYVATVDLIKSQIGY